MNKFNGTVFIVANGIGHMAGGLTQALLSRAQTLNGAGYKTSILTFNDNIRSEDSRLDLIRQGKVSKDTPWINVYDYYGAKFEQLPSMRRTIKQLIRRSLVDNIRIIKLTHDTRKESGNIRVDFHRRHLLTKKKIFDIQGNLIGTTFINKKNKPTLRKMYDRSGYIHRMVKLHPKTGVIIAEWRYTRDGFCYLTKKRIENSEDYSVTIHHRDSKSDRYNNMSAFRTAWLNDLMSDQPQKPMCIFDSPEMGVASLSMAPNVAYKILVMHGYHHDDTEPDIAAMRAHILNNLSEVDRLVVLTKRQKVDIIEEFGDFNNITVIANSARPSTLKEFPVKDTKLVSIVTRLAPQKQLDHAVKAFATASRAIPGAKLNIYGRGDSLSYIKSLVTDLSIDDKVSFKGYVEAGDVDRAYAESLVCLMTSKYEGLPLAILESMLNATPYLSYDLKYGPSDVIKDGETGYITPQDDINTMANTLEYLLNNPKKAVEAGKKARAEVIKNYSEAVILDDWVALFNSVRN